MTMDRPSFLERLLDAPGPSGFETLPARVWREEAEGFAERTWTDVSGNSYATVGEDRRPRVMLAGHVDEIGLQVMYIDDEGFLFVEPIGGWDPQVLVAQRVRVLGRNGEVPGVIGKKPIHLIRAEERKKVTEPRDLWVDLGAASREEVAEMGVGIGDPLVLGARSVRLAGDRIASRAIDNRVGAYVVLEALRLLADDPPEAGAVAVATTQEEIGYSGGGARSAAYTLEPEVALVVDVTFSTDVPDASKKEIGEAKLGGGPALTRGSAAHPLVFERLLRVAEVERIEHVVRAAPRATHTDADAIFLARTGVPTGLLSIPNRYMHSPNEIVSTGDLDRAARLIAAFIRSLDAETDFIQR